MDKEQIARNQELLNKFRPKETKQTIDPFEEKVQARLNEPIAKGAKITYADVYKYDKMSKRSIAESNERRRKIVAKEKKKQAEIKFLINAGIIALAVALLAALVKGPGEGQAFDHNGNLVNIEDVYNPGR